MLEESQTTFLFQEKIHISCLNRLLKYYALDRLDVVPSQPSLTPKHFYQNVALETKGIINVCKQSYFGYAGLICCHLTKN